VSAQPIANGPRNMPWQPDPVRQQRADYTIEDVLNLPPDAPRVELVDGVMLVVPSPTVDHQDIASLVWLWLRTHAPRSLRAVQGVGMAVGLNETFEPDVLLLQADVDGGKHYFAPYEVVLAVEVVSKGTRKRDRLSKPASYAAAGVPFYWRIEQHPVHIYAYALAEGGTYALVADSAELLELTEPFGVKLPLTEITP
jgi:Uma2 family endonuclease